MAQGRGGLLSSPAGLGPLRPSLRSVCLRCNLQDEFKGEPGPLQPRTVILQVRAWPGAVGRPPACMQTPYEKRSVPGPHPQGPQSRPALIREQESRRASSCKGQPPGIPPHPSGHREQLHLDS